MDQPVTPFDLQRMFLGEQPLLFYAEILVRTLIIYAYTLLLIRWIGGRGVAQLSMVEFLLVIALGSAVGDAMFYPEVPLLASMAVITVVIAVNKTLDRAIVRWDRAKRLIDGRPVALVRDGRILPGGLAARDLGMAEVRAMLRVEGIRNLAQVRHAFLEAGGGVSVFRTDHPGAGLRLVPPMDLLNADEWPDHPAPPLAPGGSACCGECGGVQPDDRLAPDHPCPYCGQTAWVAPELPDQTKDPR